MTTLSPQTELPTGSRTRVHGEIALTSNQHDRRRVPGRFADRRPLEPRR